jgi:hypothetical protein
MITLEEQGRLIGKWVVYLRGDQAGDLGQITKLKKCTGNYWLLYAHWEMDGGAERNTSSTEVDGNIVFPHVDWHGKSPIISLVSKPERFVAGLGID